MCALNFIRSPLISTSFASISFSFALATEEFWKIFVEANRREETALEGENSSSSSSTVACIIYQTQIAMANTRQALVCSLVSSISAKHNSKCITQQQQQQLTEPINSCVCAHFLEQWTTPDRQTDGRVYMTNVECMREKKKEGNKKGRKEGRIHILLLLPMIVHSLKRHTLKKKQDRREEKMMRGPFCLNTHSNI